MSNSKGDTKKYTQYTQPKFENVGSAPGSEIWPGFLHLKWGCWECELWRLFFLFIFEHVYPSSSRCTVFHSEIISHYPCKNLFHWPLSIDTLKRAIWSACWLLRGRKPQRRIYWLKLRDRNSSASVILRCEATRDGVVSLFWAAFVWYGLREARGDWKQIVFGWDRTFCPE